MDLIYYDWAPQRMLEVTLPEPDNFLKVKETLTRIGVASKKDKTLYQSCHILHKQGKYFIVHFKELFALDGKEANISISDIERRNTITQLLEDWELLKIVSEYEPSKQVMLSQIKIVSFSEKKEWNLVAKYNIGKKIDDEGSEV